MPRKEHLMLSDITLGQYFPGNSVIHKLDPRFKLVCIILYIVGVFSASSFEALAVVILATAAVVLLSGLGISTIARSLKPIVFILAFTMIANILWTGGETPLIKFWVITIYPEGIIFAVFTAVRIICLVIGTFVLLTYTTSPVALTDAIERLLSPLKKIGVPVHEFSMMMTIALRFIPTLIEETQKIINAQKARGADFESGNLFQRAKALVPILIPLFVSAFRRADELASAMECRLYHGGEGRTRMKIMKASARDFVSLAVFGAFAVLLICSRTVFGSVI